MKIPNLLFWIDKNSGQIFGPQFDHICSLVPPRMHSIGDATYEHSKACQRILEAENQIQKPEKIITVKAAQYNHWLMLSGRLM